MNIFYLAHNPKSSAQMQCDKHVVKMILETAQLLSTAHWELGGEGPYKATHKNHPSAVWARSNKKHYVWLYAHFRALSQEYTKRYGKVHKTWERCSQALSELPRGIPDTDWSDPPQCMPDDCKHKSTVIAYRRYYTQKGQEWSERGMPMKWFGKEQVA